MGTYERTFVVDGKSYELFVGLDGGYTLLDAAGQVVNAEPLASASDEATVAAIVRERPAA